MPDFRITSTLRGFLNNRNGEVNIQVVAFFGFLATTIVLISSPLLETGSRQSVAGQSVEFDQTLTGSVSVSDQ